MGAVAKAHWVAPWQVRRLFERHILPEPPRMGCYRVVLPEDMPRVREALRQAGYLPEEDNGHAS
jgi:hypothetical protein